MSKLKTLKDIEECMDVDGACEGCYNGQVIIEDVRQEAIKWVKNGQKEILYNIEESKMYWARRGAIQTLMDFFNITEEELEDE